jgi:ribonucleoside-triphosphate reductase
MKAGVSINPGDRNYDLYKLACKVSARRFFPNFLNLDSTFNHDNNWKEDDPRRFEHEVATMGCRTRVYENRFGAKTSIGRGNLSFSTINIPRLAILVAQQDGFLNIDTKGFDESKNTREDKERRFNALKEYIKSFVETTAEQLNDRFNFQKKALAKQFPLLMNGMWNGSENLSPDDTIKSVINQGTLGIGFIGLAEALTAITGKHHGESQESQEFGLELIEYMHNLAVECSEKYSHNYSILATPAEGLSGKFTERDRKDFGEIKGVTDRNYYTNSNHVPVYYKCTASHKAEIECPYHKFTRGGHIFYVEVDADLTKNPEVIDTINRMAIANDGGYVSINHAQGRCNMCNYESNDPNLIVGGECPHCHNKNSWDILQRITGYLVNTANRWNSYKKSELFDRVQHT